MKQSNAFKNRVCFDLITKEFEIQRRANPDFNRAGREGNARAKKGSRKDAGRPQGGRGDQSQARGKEAKIQKFEEKGRRMQPNHCQCTPLIVFNGSKISRLTS